MNRNALTLVELVIVMAILAAIAGLAVPQFFDIQDSAATNVCRKSLNELQQATARYWSDTKHVELDGVTTVASEAQRFQVQWLFRNPEDNTSNRSFNSATKIGWNGPYAWLPMKATGFAYPVILDPWDHPFVMQDVSPSSTPRDIRIISGGPNGIVDIPSNTATDSLTTNDEGDDLYVRLSLR